MLYYLLLTAMYAGVPIPEWPGRYIAERVEVWDSRERPYEPDIVTLRLRDSNKPRAVEVWNFTLPDDMRWLQWNHVVWLQARIDTEADRPAIQEEYRQWLKEATQLRDFWGLIRSARQQYLLVWTRRCDLEKARRMIGREAWHLGRQPEYLPFWRFKDD